MRLTPSDPDIETLLRRIKDGDVDLQPDFQRGEVWGEQKQKRLIDTILRNWYIPPIHVIERPNQNLEVLDGQQRLVAIRDFYAGKITLDGNLQPLSRELETLHGSRFEQLPEKLRTRFLRFPIRQYTIHGFEPGEPAELFFRLNQQVALTAAEQRNAFFGPVRDQVHQLADDLGGPKLGKSMLGFGNSRMAYDDVIARVCRTLEQGSLHYKITAADLSERYRSNTPFRPEIEGRLQMAFLLLNSALRESEAVPIRFNKPVLYSWLVFLSEIALSQDADAVVPRLAKMFSLYGEFTHGAQLSRDLHLKPSETFFPYHGTLDPEFIREITLAYIDRSTSRVSDVFSVICRDIFLWTLFFLVSGKKDFAKPCRQFGILERALDNSRALDPVPGVGFFERVALEFDWDISK